MCAGAFCCAWALGGCAAAAGVGAAGDPAGAARNAITSARSCGFETWERHLVAGHELLRIVEIGIQCLRVPGEIGVLHRRRIAVIRLGTGLAANDASKRWSKNVLAGLERMADLAFAKHELAGIA